MHVCFCGLSPLVILNQWEGDDEMLYAVELLVYPNQIRLKLEDKQMHV